MDRSPELKMLLWLMCRPMPRKHLEKQVRNWPGVEREALAATLWLR